MEEEILPGVGAMHVARIPEKVLNQGGRDPAIDAWMLPRSQVASQTSVHSLVRWTPLHTPHRWMCKCKRKSCLLTPRQVPLGCQGLFSMLGIWAETQTIQHPALLGKEPDNKAASK